MDVVTGVTISVPETQKYIKYIFFSEFLLRQIFLFNQNIKLIRGALEMSDCLSVRVYVCMYVWHTKAIV